jgi:hypothetical protein
VSKELHQELADEAGRWAAENGEPPAGTTTPGSGSSSSSAASPGAPPAAQPVSSSSERKTNVDDDEDDVDDEDLAFSPDDVAEMGVTLLDIVLTNAIGEHMALTEPQQKRLTRIAAKVARKRMPEIEGVVEPELLLVGALVATYAPKYMSGPGTKRASTTASGGAQQPGAPTPGSTTTSATVDGRPVTGEVMP